MENFELIQPVGYFYIAKHFTVIILENTDSWVTWCFDEEDMECSYPIHQSQIRYEMLQGLPRPYFRREDTNEGQSFYLNDFTWYARL